MLERIPSQDEKVKQGKILMKIMAKGLISSFLYDCGIKLKIKSKYYWMTIAGINLIKVAKNWMEMFVWRIKGPHKKSLLNMRNGVKFYVSGPADISMLTECWASEYYNPRGFELKEGDTVIDIGAHVGFFSIYAAKKIGGGRVYSFEPYTPNYKELLENIDANKILSISTFNCAVAGESGLRDFFPYEGHNGCHSLFQRGQGNSMKVNTATIREIFRDNGIARCNFLKMDCEGAEFEIIMNTAQEYLQKIDKMAGEIHEGLDKRYSPADLKKKLEDNGFEVEFKYGNFYAMADR